METVTFEIKMPYTTARVEFKDWNCGIVKMDDTYTDLTFFNEAEWKRFEQYVEEKGIEWRLV